MFLFNGPIGNSLCMVTLWIDQTRYLRPRKAIVGAQPQRADRHLAVTHSLHEPTVNRGTQPPAARVYSDLNSRSLTTSSFESDAPPVPAAGELRHIRRIMKKVRNAVFGGGVGGLQFSQSCVACVARDALLRPYSIGTPDVRVFPPLGCHAAPAEIASA